jgi:hypothetical protein
VLSRIGNPRSYAECLVTVAEKSLLRRGLGLAQAAVRGMRQTSRRVAQILAPSHRSPTIRVWKPVLAMVAAVSALGVVWLSRAPELVAVRDPIRMAAEVSTPGPNVIRALGTANAGEPVVLAKFVEDNGMTPRARVSAPQHLSAKPTAKGREERLAPEKFAAAPSPAAQAAGQPPMNTVVVMMTSTEARSGAWTVCVWRIRVVSSDAVEGRVPAHAI